MGKKRFPFNRKEFRPESILKFNFIQFKVLSGPIKKGCLGELFTQKFRVHMSLKTRFRRVSLQRFPSLIEQRSQVFLNFGFPGHLKLKWVR